MIPAHPLFASCMGTLQRRTPEYFRIHASLVESYRASKSARLSKRQRALMRKLKFRQNGDVHG